MYVKVYFSIVTHLCNHQHNQNRISVTPKVKIYLGSFAVKSPTNQPQGTKGLLSVITDSICIF